MNITDEKRAENRAKRARKRLEKRAPVTAAPLRGCGWNHRVPGSEALDGVIKPRPWDARIAKRPRRKHKSKVLGQPTNGIVGPVECNSEWERGGARCQAPRRTKTIERLYGRSMSWTEKVQHGIVREE